MLALQQVLQESTTEKHMMALIIQLLAPHRSYAQYNAV